MPRIDYAAHDGEYVRRRAAGRPGWDTESGLLETITSLEQAFQDSCFPRRGRLLELGCGAGNVSLWAARRGYEVSGIDISPTAIAWAVENAQRARLTARFVVGNVVDLGRYGTDLFDVVLDGHCLHCIIGEDRSRVLREVWRVLKPGGVFHLRSMCGDPTCEEHRHHFDPATRCMIYGDIVTRFLGQPEQIEKEVRMAGFTILQQRVLPRRSPEDVDDLLLNATK